MIAADASAAIASFARWHERRPATQRALGDHPAIVAHAAFETYSVLTRMPEPQRSSPAVVRVQLERRFADRWIGLTAGELRQALERLEQLGISGGRTYDGLIAITAASNDATLVTLDRRALPTYLLVGVSVELVDGL